MTQTIYINNKDTIKINTDRSHSTGLLNGRVGDLMGEPLSYIWRWFKTVMKQVITVIEKGTELVAKNQQY
jgi:hypothetical protein